MSTAPRCWPRMLLRPTFALLLAALPAGAALGQGADALALTIEQSLAGIEYRADIRPTQAARDLEQQQRQLELLEQQAPDHPALPGLKERFEELQAALASGLAEAAGDAATGQGASQIPTAPEAFTAGLEEVAALHDEAEAAFLRDEPAEAADFLKQAETQLTDLEARYADAIPPAHVPLIVTKEKIAALKDQLGDAGATD